MKRKTTIAIQSVLGFAVWASATLAMAQAADVSEVDALQGRLKALATAGVSDKSYNYAKAQCWLDAARTGASENDRTGFTQGAMTEAGRIISALEADKNAQPANDTPLIAGSSKLREDLWSKFAGLKSEAQFSCGAQAVACGEVRLVRAGHAHEQFGWRSANAHAYLAECAARDAAKAIAECAPPPAPPAPPPPPPPPAPEPEKIDVPADALFKFDRSDLNNVLPEGKQKLDELVERLKGWKQITKLNIKGYTDRLGSDAYNLKLSQARADTIKEYFASHGIKADEATATGMGKANPVTGDKCTGKMAHAKLIECLQPDRRIELEVSGVKQ